VEKPQPGRSTDQPRPRDGDVAIRQQLAAARRAGTLAAYDVVLRLDGNHPLAEPALRERAALAARPCTLIPAADVCSLPATPARRSCGWSGSGWDSRCSAP